MSALKVIPKLRWHCTHTSTQKQFWVIYTNDRRQDFSSLHVSNHKIEIVFLTMIIRILFDIHGKIWMGHPQPWRMRWSRCSFHEGSGTSFDWGSGVYAVSVLRRHLLIDFVRIAWYITPAYVCYFDIPSVNNTPWSFHCLLMAVLQQWHQCGMWVLGSWLPTFVHYHDVVEWRESSFFCWPGRFTRTHFCALSKYCHYCFGGLGGGFLRTTYVSLAHFYILLILEK